MRLSARVTVLYVFASGASAAWVAAPVRAPAAARHDASRMNIAYAPPAAPPASPPRTGDDGGGGGGGQKEFLRLLTAEEAKSTLTEWTSRTRIYKLTDDPDLESRHTMALDVLTAMEGRRARAEEESLGTHRLTLGLFDEERLWAISEATISASDGLMVNTLAVLPEEINTGGQSTAALRLLCGLHSLSETIEVDLNLDPLRSINCGRFWLAGLALLSTDERESATRDAPDDFDDGCEVGYDL